MTDLRQAAQQALDFVQRVTAWEGGSSSISGLPDRHGTLTALRTALAMNQAEPSQWRDMVVVNLVREGVNKHKARELADHFAAPPQLQAEPVAYFDFQELKFSWAKHMKISPVPVSVKVEPMKLYSESTKREWVGLTDEDVNRESAPIARQMKLAFHAGMYVAQKILKEKNDY
jgi:hypothetical protein